MHGIHVVDEMVLLREEVTHVKEVVINLDASVKTLQTSTAEVVETFKALKAFALVFAKIVKGTILCAKFVGGVVFVIGAVWGVAKAAAHMPW